MQPIEGRILNLWNTCSEGTKALGPGLRYVIWTQGCLRRCPGCISPESQPIKPKLVVEVEFLADDIAKNGKLSGITISGGEPFLQAASLSKLIQLVKQKRPELNAIVFTGFYKDELKWNDAENLLELADVLIDGPFCLEQISDKGLRGSLNQKFHFLTDALKGCREELENAPRKMEVYVEENELVTIGIPNGKQNIIL